MGNVERHKAKLVAKGFNQREGIDYTETFSPISKKDYLRIIMALVAHFDFDLHQMDVKMAFLNGNLEEEVYMKQLGGFSSSEGEQLVCELKKSIYGLKQASRQWYLKFHEIIASFGFEENIIDQCIYQKVGGSKICFLVLYVDDILLATNDKGLLYEVKQFLSKNFDMKDMGEASYVTPRIPARPDWQIRTGFRDARLRTGTLNLIFFFKTELVPVGMAHILKQNPNIIYKSKNYHRSGVHQTLYTYN